MQIPIQIFANPARFLQVANAILPWAWGITAVLFVIGLYGGLYASPPDALQGESARIIFIHVPAASAALYIYVIMALLSATAFIYRHPLADAAAKAAAPIGATMCFIALVTGSIWGKPTWGTWWVWDGRLTSMFVLMLLYLGYIAIWQALEDPHRAAPMARIVALVGAINVPIVKFSVNWWWTLHQPASLIRSGGPTIDDSMLWPLLVMIAAFAMLFVSLHLTGVKSEIAARKLHAQRLSAAGER